MSRHMYKDWDANWNAAKILVDVDDKKDCFIQFSPFDEDVLAELFILAYLCGVRLRDDSDGFDFVLAGVENPEDEELIKRVNRLVHLLVADEWEMIITEPRPYPLDYYVINLKKKHAKGETK